ncbi:MAG: DUF5335 family protein [Gemmatimonadota bacterium]|jgi:hypothetical protein|nr:MAG: DUF5335 family protein [Gemmatimonadota bacterium]
MYRDIPRELWANVLEAFTERNAQRPTLIQIDSPEFGAQEQERGFPLRGIAYDRRDDRISIMLGELEGAEPHLTHSISDIESLSIGSGGAGEGREVIRIAHDDSQTFVWVK